VNYLLAQGFKLKSFLFLLLSLIAIAFGALFDCQLAVADNLSSSRLEAMIERARQLQLHNHYRESLEYCHSILKSEPDCAAALALRGAAEVAIGQVAQAKIDLDRAIKLQPGVYSYYRARAFAYIELNKTEAAISDLLAAEKCHDLPVPSKLSNDRRARAELLAGQHKYDLAMAVYAQAIKTAPHDIDNFTSRGHTYFNMGRYQNAVDDYTLAIKIKPSDIRTFGYRASAYSKLGQLEKANADLRAANQGALDY